MIRVVLNRPAVQALLKSPEVRRDLQRRAQKIAAVAGAGYEAQIFAGRNRARATVRTATDAAKVNEEQNHSLERAINAGK